MVSERQSGLEPKTDPVDSEGVVEMLAEMVLSMEMLLLAVQHLVCCTWCAAAGTKAEQRYRMPR